MALCLLAAPLLALGGNRYLHSETPPQRYEREVDLCSDLLVILAV